MKTVEERKKAIDDRYREMGVTIESVVVDLIIRIEDLEEMCEKYK